ncbi:MAG: gamma-glutamyltransferase [Bryobacteraceae bacterium]
MMRPIAALCLAIVVSPVAARQPVRARKAMVAAQEPLAADIGLEVLRSGGNAVDAAVAVGFALAVTLPSAGNLGGGGFLLYRAADGKTRFFDFREAAPAASGRDMYLDPQGNLTDASRIGWRAAGVPGTVRGLELAHRTLGSRKWSTLLKPAVDLARKGHPLSWARAESMKDAKDLLGRFDESRKIFLNGGRFYEMDDRFRQRDLAATLARIAKHGARDFYEGETAHRLAAAMKANGGLITEEDLRAYKAVEREPIAGRYKGYDVITAPPPSSGGIGILQMMGVLEGSNYEKPGAGAAETIHFVAETMRRFYADRSEHFGDPDFFRVPALGLLDPAYLNTLRNSIDRAHASKSDEVRPGRMPVHESADTTHFSIVDAQGNAVALTYTINGSYGNGVTVPGLGFLLNNEMDDFAAKPGVPNMFGLVQGEANAIQPRKRPLSSMTPTILARDGKLFMVVGAPGGSRIINGVLQVILNVVDHRMNVQDAIDAPRFHHQWQPDRLSMERGFSPDTRALLEAKGHMLAPISGVAVVEAIVLADGWLQGGSDGRGAGKAVGY